MSCLVQGQNNGFGVMHKPLSRWRQCRPGTVTHEKCRTQICLKPLDAAAHCGLCYMQASCRFIEAAISGYREKRFDLIDIHVFNIEYFDINVQYKSFVLYKGALI